MRSAMKVHEATLASDLQGSMYCTGVAIYVGSTMPVPLLDMYTRGVTFHVSTIPTNVVDWEDAPRAWLEPSTKLVVSRT